MKGKKRGNNRTENILIVIYDFPPCELIVSFVRACLYVLWKCDHPDCKSRELHGYIKFNSQLCRFLCNRWKP